MTSDNSDQVGLKAQIQRYLVESGNYEKISNELNQKLYEDGWINTVHNMTTEEIDSSGSTVYSQVLEKVEPKALELVSNSTKEEIMDQIKNFLEEIVDTN